MAPVYQGTAPMPPHAPSAAPVQGHAAVAATPGQHTAEPAPDVLGVSPVPNMAGSWGCEMIRRLPEKLVRQLPLTATVHYPVLQSIVRTAYDDYERRAAREVELAHLVNDTDYVPSSKYHSNKSSKEYEMAFDAVKDLGESIMKVKNEASSEMTLRSRCCALRALISIGESTIDAPSSTLGSEVRKAVGKFETMCAIINGWPEDHRLQHRQLEGPPLSGGPSGVKAVTQENEVQSLETAQRPTRWEWTWRKS